MYLHKLWMTSPCCLALDGTGMLLNSFTSLTLSGTKNQQLCLWTLLCWNSTVSGKSVTYKLSIMGVEVHGLWVSLCSGMDFIRWYMGGHAIRACRVWVIRVREINSKKRKNRRTCLQTFLVWYKLLKVLIEWKSFVFICGLSLRCLSKGLIKYENIIHVIFSTELNGIGKTTQNRGSNSRVKGYSVDIAPVSLVDQSSRLQRHWFMYQLHILYKFWGD